MHNFKMSERGLEVLMELEGVENKIYDDVAGFPTIGVGHLLLKDELMSGKIVLSTGKVIDIRTGRITNTEVKALLQDDIVRYENAVNNGVTVEITQEHFDALTSFTFNVGCGAFSRSTLLKRLNAKRYNDVPAQFKRWNKAGGRVIKGLSNRRNVEIAMWNTKRDNIDYSNFA